MPEQNLKHVNSILDGLTNSIGKITLLVGSVTAAVTAVINYFTSKTWYEIGVGICIVLIVAFVAIRFYRRQEKTAQRNRLADISGAAFRGLLPYEEGDSKTFFGRETDIGEILQMVRYSEFRFGVLTGESGCGKTSLLRAGLIPKLKEANDLPVYLRLYGNPEQQIRQAVEKQTGLSATEGEDLQGYLQRVVQEKKQTLLLCCDQFEEFFVNHPDAASRKAFIEFVANCYQDQTLAVKFLFSLRQDYLEKISQFDGLIPEPLAISKRYHLHNFDAAQAETIIQRCVTNAGLPFESSLSHAIAQALVKANKVLPTELQIVCQQLQRQHIYTTEKYQESGGKESLVYAFLEDVIKGAGCERDVKLVLRSMISEEDTKLTQTVEQIARNSQQSANRVESILDQFVGARLVREIQDQEPWHYELMHEYLIGKINALTGSVMDTVKRANHIFKQWLNRYRHDNKTLIPLADCRFIYRFSDLEKNGTAGELLAKSLRWGWLKIVVFAVAGLGLFTVVGWYFWTEIGKRDRNMGVLAINNPIGAQLTLQQIRHYHKKVDKRVTIAVNDSKIYLEGPADYQLNAEINGTTIAYPVFIETYGHTINVTIAQPPKQATLPKEMAYIPAGTFRMGDKVKNDGLDGNAPAHDVFLDAFLIDKTEVSNEDFAKFIEAGGYETEKLWKDDNQTNQAGLKFLIGLKEPKFPRYWNDEKFNQEKQPVVGVSWFEARAYCRWKNKQLPTEAQWEKAARGPEGYEYSFGNTWDKTIANSIEKQDGFIRMVPMEYSHANTYGLYNMSGNVSEWAQDFYEYIFYTPNKTSVANPVNIQTEEFRVIRGGSWYIFPEDLRASDRRGNDPGNRGSGLGFRCARTL